MVTNYDLQTAVVRSLSMYCFSTQEPSENLCILTPTFLLLIYTGTLDYKELQAALSEVMMTEVTLEHVQMVSAEFDKDGNGAIDMSEFAMMVVRTYHAFLSC